MNCLKTMNKRFFFILISLSLLLFFSCEDDEEKVTYTESDCEYELNEVALGYATALPGDCDSKIDIADGSVVYKEFKPILGDNPNQETYDYRFLIREGSSNKILINFMGGGACWSGENCLDEKTNIAYSDIAAMIDAPHFIVKAQQGIILHNNEDNPFVDWTLVFLPYTTADIHWGSSEYDYTDIDGNTVTVNHRGHDNFLSALRYLKDTYAPDTIDQVFVTGQSAGAYGAIFNFPYIKEVYNSSIVDVLGDGGNGVITEEFMTDTIHNWNILENLPTWIDEVNEDNFNELSMGEVYKKIADYYPESNVAQFTGMYDGNQRYFYYVMKTLNTLEWHDVDGMGVKMPDVDTCYWRDTMLEQDAVSSEAANFHSYIGYGSRHTITTTEDIYTYTTDGVVFIDWLKQMIEHDSAWSSVMCTECQPPNTEESPTTGIVCP